jgi:hypothetical protein
MKMTHIKLAVLVTSLVLTPLFATLAQAKQAPRSDVNLTGEFTYFTYASQSQPTSMHPNLPDKILQDNVYPTTATLVFHPDNVVTLELLEDHLMDYPNDPNNPFRWRSSILVGSMTPSGAMKVIYDFSAWGQPPTFIIDVVKAHAGVTVSGNFPWFFGTYDGKKLCLVTEFNSQCKEYWPANDLFDTPVVGPLHWKWIVDLTVNE